MESLEVRRLVMANKGLGLHIEIKELDNGFVVDFFSEKGGSKFDKSVYCATMLDVVSAVQDWVKKVRKKEA